jgi:putative hemin transport protein
VNAPSPSLAQRHDALLSDQPRLRIRDAAAHLGVREAELLQVQPGATRLRPDWAALYRALPSLGRVMCLTRNEHCVHERRGAFVDVDPGPGHILVLGPDIDLRGFPRAWGAAWAQVVPGHHGPMHSVQVFDRHGDAAQKIYVEPGGDQAAWEDLVAGFAAPELAPFAPVPVPPAPVEVEVDPRELLLRWASLKDTHDFFPMLRKVGATRLQAVHLAEGPFTRRLAPDAPKDLLHRVAAAELPIMVFVGNRGMIQIHSGPVRRVVERDGWLNVMDPDFNLHLRLAGVAEAWEVRKPTVDGDVNALELYDDRREVVAQLFGVRKPGQPEDPRWTAALRSCAGRAG